MSYYQGDYYRGDPGFFSFLGGIAKKAVGFIPGVGPVAKTALDMIPTGASKGRAIATAGKAIVSKVKGGIVKHPVLSAAGAAGAVGIGAGVGGAKLLGHHAALGLGRRHRRMNVCNPRALRRAIRRTHGFARLAMKTIHLVHPKKHVRFGGFKVRRKKK